jgi:hypothetical protein
MSAPTRNRQGFIAGALLGAMPTHWLMGLLGVVLLISAVKTFQHAR